MTPRAYLGFSTKRLHFAVHPPLDSRPRASLGGALQLPVLGGHRADRGSHSGSRPLTIPRGCRRHWCRMVPGSRPTPNLRTVLAWIRDIWRAPSLGGVKAAGLDVPSRPTASLGLVLYGRSWLVPMLRKERQVTFLVAKRCHGRSEISGADLLTRWKYPAA